MAATAEEPAAALLDRGSGPALLLLHGWGAHKELMAPIAERLSGYRIVAPDLPGFGATPAPPRAWGVDEYAAWLVALLDRLGVERAHVVGHSNGGRVAIALAAAHPDRVGRLVLTDSAGIRPRRGVVHRWRVGAFKVARAVSGWPW
ncbi:MAG: alpha/beta fold hydrolase, partial [Candidatus Dormibacteria bacterium]